MWIEGILWKNTFGPLNGFRTRIAHNPHLMVDRRGEIVDLAKLFMFLTNKDGGPIQPNAHWFWNGEKVATTRMEMVRYLVAHEDVSNQLEEAITNHILETTSYIPLLEQPKKTKKQGAKDTKDEAENVSEE